MDTPVYLGLSRHPWPYSYVIQSLQFFAMDVPRLRAYSPAPFPPLMFEQNNGRIECTGNPLYALVFCHGDGVEAGIRWNDWIEPQDGEEDESLPPMFAALEQTVEVLLKTVDRARPVEETLAESACAATLDRARAIARELLARTGWAEPDPVPYRSAAEMLSEGSRGAYEDLMAGLPVDPWPEGWPHRPGDDVTVRPVA